MAHLPPRRHRRFSMATGMRRRPGFVPAGGRNGLSISTSGEEVGTVTSTSAAEETPEARCSYDGGHRRRPPPSNHFPPFFGSREATGRRWQRGKRRDRRQQLQCAPLQEAQLDGKKLEKDDKRRLCQWWWRHWNAILVVILDMAIVKARRWWPTFTHCKNWINNDGNSSARP
uniref:Uncharacterized protein n=1 Tax=Oryza meridionalis TaxID=40149 RepID=A0A0E0CE32_9ORYZ